MKIDLKTQKEADPILEIEIANNKIDLHNDYIVNKINIENRELIISLQKSLPTVDYTPKSPYPLIKLVFINNNFIRGNIDSIQKEKQNSLDNLSRSTGQNNILSYYIFSFIDGDEYEIECEDAFIEIM